MSAKPTIGFVGVGSMGWPMAALLHKAGYPLQIVDASADRAKEFVTYIYMGGRYSFKPMGACRFALGHFPNSPRGLR